MIIAFPSTLENDTAPHSHQVHELVVGFAGDARLCAGGQAHEISTRRVVLVPAGTPHHYELMDRSRPAVMTFICFDSRSLEGSCPAPILQAKMERLLSGAVTSAPSANGACEETAVLVKILNDTLEGGMPYYREKSGSILATILINHLTAVESPGNLARSSRSDEIRKVIKWVGDHLSDEISIELAAKRAHMSRSVFTRCFKEYTNLTFCHYVNNARLKLAAGLLVKGSLPIVDVACQSGYRNLGHFYSHFQKQYGVTPNEYRRMSVDTAE